MEFDATFWALIALLIFFALITYFGVPRLIAKTLDGRIAKIEADIEQARRLREEAQALLAEYERKRQDAEAEAAEIVAAAREDADRLTVEAKQALGALVARRTRTVEDKIAQAEAQALADVRARSADIAVEAARILLAEQIKDKREELIDQSIVEVGSKLN